MTIIHDGLGIFFSSRITFGGNTRRANSSLVNLFAGFFFRGIKETSL